jgi:NAD(P)-dependent dehydrogenase (short-subunit alcohol dehydrogenase family)
MGVDYGIAGKCAFVMGGTRGIGRGVAEALARSGCKVAVAGRLPEHLDSTVAALKALGVEALGVEATLTDIRQFDATIARVSQELAPPDIAIFNPQPPRAGRFDEMSEDDYTQTFERLVIGFIRMSRLVLPHMQAQGWGRIVTIGSAAVKQPARGKGYSYALGNTIRLAAASVCKQMAPEVGPFGVTVNTIATGTIATDASAAFIADRAREGGTTAQALRALANSHVPVGRQGTVEEIASLAAYLCSRQAAYTTGEAILCDGGSMNCIV